MVVTADDGDLRVRYDTYIDEEAIVTTVDVDLSVW